MENLGFFLYVIALFLIYTVIYLFIKRKLKIKEGKLFYTHVNKTHKILEITLIITYIMAMPFYFYFVRMEPHDLLIFLFLLYLIRSIMEFNFDKKSKAYVLSILNVIFIAFLFITLDVFFI